MGAMSSTLAEPQEAARGWTRRVEAWVTLHALGAPGRSFDRVLELGGPEAVLLGGGDALLEVLRSRRGPARPHTDAALERARSWARKLRPFVDGGGLVLGPGGRGELGRLLRAPSPPLCIYGRGAARLLYERPCVALVGTREPTARGEARSFAFAEALARAGATVVSGGARGVDLAAHRGALAGGGGTVVVLGDPLKPEGDERPGRVRGLEGDALTLTPHGPWVPMAKTLFVSRNRLVAALADALVVVEAGATSGTRHTVEAALKIGVPVYAVPGDPDFDNAFTPNRLILSGRARPLLDVDDLLRDLGLAAPAPVARPQEGEPSPPATDAPLRVRLLAAVRRAGGAIDVDFAALSLDAPIAELLREALLLELEGKLRREGSRLLAG